MHNNECCVCAFLYLRKPSDQGHRSCDLPYTRFEVTFLDHAKRPSDISFAGLLLLRLHGALFLVPVKHCQYDTNEDALMLSQRQHENSSFRILCLADNHQYKWGASNGQINGYGSAKMVTRKELHKRSGDFLVDGALHVHVAIQVQAPYQVHASPQNHLAACLLTSPLCSSSAESESSSFQACCRVEKVSKLQCTAQHACHITCWPKHQG